MADGIDEDLKMEVDLKINEGNNLSWAEILDSEDSNGAGGDPSGVSGTDDSSKEDGVSGTDDPSKEDGVSGTDDPSKEDGVSGSDDPSTESGAGDGSAALDGTLESRYYITYYIVHFIPSLRRVKKLFLV